MLFKKPAYFILCCVFFPLLSLAEPSAVWKISKGSDYLYLGGTVHLLPQSEFPLPAGYDRAFADTDVLVLETELPQSDADQQQMLQGLMYQPGKTLDQVLQAGTYRRLARYLQANGLTLADYRRYTPGFMLMLMTQIETDKLGVNGEGVDMFYQHRAEQQPRPLWYLEALQFQVSLLAGLGEGYEDQFIRSMLDESSEAEQMLRDTLRAWRSADLAMIEQLLNQPTRKDDPVTYRALFTDRNNHWLPVIEGWFGNEHKELVLVGIAHLAGKDGLIHLLQQQGYQTEQLVD